MVDKKLVSRQELADILGVHKQTVYNMTREGMPQIKMGYNLVRYDPEEVIEWLKTRGKNDNRNQGGKNDE